MAKISKYQIYRWVKFFVLSYIIVYYLYIKSGFPILLTIILEILLIIKLLPISRYIEKIIIRHYPKYGDSNIWIKRIVLFACYILIYMILKFLIVNVIMMELLDIPVEEQIYEFINKTNLE